ncbi:MAG: FAD-binding protein [Coriobacteriales bacterium]|jgi:succinate dehydrogenase/fumarate reductase flavoprotein subunit|nr:FAD-binding protein [Coriobacteriales bacterium]
MQNQLDRRSFLKGATVAGAAALAGVATSGLTGCTPGASRTQDAPVSDGLINAQIYAKQKWAFEVAPDPIPDEQIVETKTADIIVIGSGTSGLAAATSAAENGAKVILISASSVNVSRGGSVHAMNSKFMRAHANEFPLPDTDKYFRDQLLHASYNVDEAKWWKWNRESEESMDWLINKMEDVGYTTVFEAGFSEPDGPMDMPVGSHSWNGDGITGAGGSQQLVVDTLANNAKKAGAEIIYGMAAKQLVRDNNNTGRVSAVVAQDVNDETWHKYEGTKAIIMAMGDFSADKDMMSKYCPHALPLVSDIEDVNYDIGFTFGGLYKGEGHKMGLWVGAAWQKTFPNAAMTLAVGTAGPANQPCGAFRGLLVNRDGQRYANENVTGVFANISQMHQPEGKGFALWSANYAKDAAPWYSVGMTRTDAPIPPEAMLAQWQDDSNPMQNYVVGNTIDEVISALGLPLAETKATVERYNSLCAKGADDDFCKNPSQMVPLTEAPFFGAAGSPPMFLTVLGGLRTDINMRVCDENDNPIPGLYNIGTMVGDYYSGFYTFLIEGNNLGATCLTFGYVTGRDIAKGLI